MASISCDIVMLPSPELAHKAMATSRRLRSYGTLYMLEDGECYPHASLYMTQLKVDDLEKVKQLLSELASTTPTFELTATRYHQAERYIDVEYERTEALARLQMQIVSLINPLRDGLRANDEARLPTLSGLIRENVEKYGYRGVGELFNPHMSFTRFEHEHTMALDSLPPAGEWSGRFPALGLFEMGPHNGTCVRKIAGFNFL